VTKPVIDGEGWYVRRDGKLVKITHILTTRRSPFKACAGIGAFVIGVRKRWKLDGSYYLDGGWPEDIIRRATPAEIEAGKSLSQDTGGA